MRFKKIIMLCCLFFSVPLFAKTNWQTYVDGLRVEAISKGIRPEVFDAAFQGMQEPHHKILKLDRSQPEKRITYLQYRNSRVDAYRIKLGHQEMKKNIKLLNQIGAHYGVDPAIIVSLWGLESSYGRFMGNFPVIRSLATLAYDHRRASFFRRELFFALEMLNEGHVTLEKLKGEWAGGTGQSQFLPSSWHNYAEDYDGDGRKDIWNSQSDVFASIANYLAKNGWQTNAPYSITVTLPAQFDHTLASLKIVKTVGEWEKLGVRVDAKNIASTLPASIVEPDGGPAMMVFNNFKVIMKWNHSIYYAATVEYLAEKMKS